MNIVIMSVSPGNRKDSINHTHQRLPFDLAIKAGATKTKNTPTDIDKIISTNVISYTSHLKPQRKPYPSTLRSLGKENQFGKCRLRCKPTSPLTEAMSITVAEAHINKLAFAKI